MWQFPRGNIDAKQQRAFQCVCIIDERLLQLMLSFRVRSEDGTSLGASMSAHPARRDLSEDTLLISWFFFFFRKISQLPPFIGGASGISTGIKDVSSSLKINSRTSSNA